jgi:PBP1b-binding outer membrane lipoprotein LpoB
MAVDYVIVRQQGVSSPGGQPVNGEEIMNPPVVQSMIDDSQIEVFSYEGNLYFKNTGNDELKGRVDIYNITGQLVKSINISGSGNFQIASGLRPGLYIVRLKAGNQAISRKILVN